MKNNIKNILGCLFVSISAIVLMSFAYGAKETVKASQPLEPPTTSQAERYTTITVIVPGVTPSVPSTREWKVVAPTKWDCGVRMNSNGIIQFEDVEGNSVMVKSEYILIVTEKP